MMRTATIKPPALRCLEKSLLVWPVGNSENRKGSHWAFSLPAKEIPSVRGGQRQLALWSQPGSLEGGAGWYRDSCRTSELKSVFRKAACSDPRSSSTIGPGVPPLTHPQPSPGALFSSSPGLTESRSFPTLTVPCFKDASKCLNPTPGPTCCLRLPDCQGL